MLIITILMDVGHLFALVTGGDSVQGNDINASRFLNV